ncbi:MAG: hypothetical protein QM765_25340 [Myxococcales bacterium]
MTHRLALAAAALALSLSLVVPGAAAAAAAAAAPAKEKGKAPAKASAKGEKAKAGDKAKKGEEPAPSTIVVDGQPAGDDPEFAKAGKVIEFDRSGKAKVVRGTDTGGDLPTVVGTAEELPPAMEERQGAELHPSAAGSKSGPGAHDLTAREACKLRLGAQCQMLVRCSGGAFPIDCDQMSASCEDAEGIAPYSRKDAEACAKGVSALKCATVNSMGLNFNPEAKVAACKPIRESESESDKPAPKPAKGIPGAGQDFRNIDVDVGGILGGGGE